MTARPGIFEFLGFAVCLAVIGEALMAALGYTLRHWGVRTKKRGALRRTERPWRGDGRVLGAASALVAWPLGTPHGLVLWAGVATAAILYILPLPRRMRDGWGRGRIVARLLACAAVLAAVAGVVRVLMIPGVGRYFGGAVVGLWIAFALTEWGPVRRLRTRSRTPGTRGWIGSAAARRWLGSVSRPLVVGSALGLLVVFWLSHRHILLAPGLGAPVTGLVVGPAIAVVVDNGQLTTLAEIVRHRRTPPSSQIARLKVVVILAGALGAAAGAVAMPSPWRWIGVEALAVATFVVALRWRRRHQGRYERGTAAAGVPDGKIPAEWERRQWASLAVVSGVTVLLSMEHTVLNVALPTIQRDTGATTSDLTWIVDAFILSYTGFLLTAAKLGDRFGRQRALRVGLGVFAASSVACGFATTPGWLIADRYWMGLGAAGMLPSTLSTIRAVFPAGKRLHAMALWSASYGLGIALGPVVGGIVVEHFGWHWIFWGLAPIGLILLAATRLVPNSRDSTRRQIDIPGAALSVAWSTLVVWGVIEAPSLGWTDPRIVAAFGAGAATLTLFLAWELVSVHPLFDLGLLRDRRFSAPAGALSLVYFALMGTLFVLTTYLQVVRGYAPVSAGIRTLPVAGALILVSVPAGRLAERWRYGPKLAVTAGLSLIAVALFHMATTTLASAYTLTFISLVVAGVGIGMAQAPATSSLMEAVPPDHASVGSASNDTTRLMGGMFGIAVLSSVVASIYSARTSIAVTQMRIPGHELHVVAAGAYIAGMDSALRVAGWAAALSAVAVLLFLPARERNTARVAGVEPSMPAPPEPSRPNSERNSMNEASASKTRDWPLHRVETSRGPLWVHDTGPTVEGDDTVVLVGGLGPSVYGTFSGVVDSLSGYRVVGLDNRGHGFGRRNPSAHRKATDPPEILEECALDLAALIEALSVGRVSIVAHSSGGAIVQLLARARPELVERMVFAGSAARFDNPRVRRVTMMPPWLRRLAAPSLFLRFASGSSDVHRGDIWEMTEFANEVGRFDSGAWAGALEPAAAVLVFEDDRTVSPDAQFALARTLRARPWWVPVGHLPMTSEKERPAFTTALVEALESTLRGSETTA